MSSIFTLLSQAAYGVTFEELRNGFNLRDNKTATATEYFERNKQLLSNAGETTLTIANQIYVHQHYSLNPTFKQVAVKKFSSGIESVDFCNSDESARIINNFVEEKTRKKIRDIIEASSIRCAFDRMILINAIYFKGNWLYQFDEKLTKNDVFYPNEIDAIYVDFMNIRKRFNVLHLDELNARALELKYANSKFSFVIVLPNKFTGLAALESKLKNYDLMKDFMDFDSGSKKDYVVKVPKFKVEYDIKLNKILINVSVIKNVWI